MTARKVKIAASILSADFSILREQIRQAEKAGADWLHLDVMDGRFVPNITFGAPVVKALRPHSSLPFDTHLMIEDPDGHLEAFREAGADIITVHVEACRHLHRTIERIKSLGAQAGVSINPATPVSALHEVVRQVDLILIMSVNPGFGGQTFIGRSLDKLREAADLIKTTNPAVNLEVDGGIDHETAPLAVAAGANILVSGKFVFGSPDIGAAINTLRGNTSP